LYPYSSSDVIDSFHSEQVLSPHLTWGKHWNFDIAFLVTNHACALLCLRELHELEDFYLQTNDGNKHFTGFYRATTMLSAVYAVVVCLSVRLQIMPHDRPETLVGPILWGHSGPLFHALSLLSSSSSLLLWTSMRRRRATVATPGEWQCGVRRLAVANGPNIFQMLLLFKWDVL